MLRISLERSGWSSNLVIRLDGQVAGPWVRELRSACDAARVGSDLRGLTLDMSGVTSLGPDGITLIRELRAEGALLTHASVFVTEQLKGIADVNG